MNNTILDSIATKMSDKEMKAVKGGSDHQLAIKVDEGGLVENSSSCNHATCSYQGCTKGDGTPGQCKANLKLDCVCV